MGQHKFLSIKDRHFSKKGRRGYDGEYKGSTLDEMLTKLKAKGIKVLDFRRVFGKWEIKAMAKKEAA